MTEKFSWGTLGKLPWLHGPWYCHAETTTFHETSLWSDRIKHTSSTSIPHTSLNSSLYSFKLWSPVASFSIQMQKCFTIKHFLGTLIELSWLLNSTTDTKKWHAAKQVSYRCDLCKGAVIFWSTLYRVILVTSILHSNLSYTSPNISSTLQMEGNWYPTVFNQSRRHKINDFHYVSLFPTEHIISLQIQQEICSNLNWNQMSWQIFLVPFLSHFM